MLGKVLPERLPLRTTDIAYHRAVLHHPLEALPLRGVRVQSHAESMTDSRTHCLHAVRQRGIGALRQRASIPAMNDGVLRTG